MPILDLALASKISAWKGSPILETHLGSSKNSVLPILKLLCARARAGPEALILFIGHYNRGYSMSRYWTETPWLGDIPLPHGGHPPSSGTSMGKGYITSPVDIAVLRAMYTGLCTHACARVCTCMGYGRCMLPGQSSIESGALPYTCMLATEHW